MLAGLALTDDFVDWSDPEAVRNLRIMDPACGTGTLLMATLQTIKARVTANREMTDKNRNALHKQLVEDVLCGLDINQHAVQLAACNMTLGAPTVDYERMNLHAMQHGINDKGEARAGSLEILVAADVEDNRKSLHSLTQALRGLKHLDAMQVANGTGDAFRLKNVDLVIMNPPFTDNTKRGRKFGTDAIKKMQDRELHIRDEILNRDEPAGRLITTDSVRTFFTPLAETLLKKETGTLAQIVPTTACIASSGTEERRFLTSRYQVELIITSHDPKRPNFSENTAVHESLLVCRRNRQKTRTDTKFVSLQRMPTSVAEAIAAADAITSGRPDQWGSSLEWPYERMMGGNWTPAQWYDGTLAIAARQLEESNLLEPLNRHHKVGPMGRAAQNSWKRCDEDEARENEHAVRIYDTISAKVRRRMEDDPEQWVIPGGGKRPHLWAKILKQGSDLLVAERFDTIGGRLTAICGPQKTFGFGWRPVSTADRRESQAICAWWNSTPGRILLLNRRAKKLTYPNWSTEHLQEMPIPRLNDKNIEVLTRAWNEHKSTELKELGEADSDHARIALDDAAAAACGIAVATVAEWRTKLSREPHDKALSLSEIPHLFAHRQSAAQASASLQNHRSPFAVSMWVFAYDAGWRLSCGSVEVRIPVCRGILPASSGFAGRVRCECFIRRLSSRDDPSVHCKRQRRILEKCAETE